eukprot:4739579-Amphidinium_carterae.1
MRQVRQPQNRRPKANQNRNEIDIMKKLGTFRWVDTFPKLSNPGQKRTKNIASKTLAFVCTHSKQLVGDIMGFTVSTLVKVSFFKKGKTRNR